MKILNFGSLNIDYVYRVAHLVRGGETLSSQNREVYCGGKGLNQSVAIARAGAHVYHAGAVGDEGAMLLTVCDDAGVDRRFVNQLSGANGHTMIQVDDAAENGIILYGGTNRRQSLDHIEKVFDYFESGDYLVLQNEINLLDVIVDKGYDKQMKIILNPSPYDESIASCDLSKVGLFLINETEGRQITNRLHPDDILDFMTKTYPMAETVLTLGSKGAIWAQGSNRLQVPAKSVAAVDTTGAGDTFAGYFIAMRSTGNDPREALEIATAAAALAVTREGAIPSIPWFEEVIS